MEPAKAGTELAAEHDGKGDLPAAGSTDPQPLSGTRLHRMRAAGAGMLQRLAADRPQLVLLGMSRRYGSTSGSPATATWLDALTALVSELREITGARVLVLGPVPDPHSVVPVCVSGELDEANAQHRRAPRRSTRTTYFSSMFMTKLRKIDILT